ncbi:MAG: 6,7-dimethyl-8-ribityllumazine synthase [Thermotogota bacterium]|nr:6,7-dimethyl-8-ribityllumazine synthase [Thermotogota bacterium]MDK2865670.1 6,7-dimethyl-8-ribityllumazine synthase [Thermotogota bacterium]HCZ06609.1 6,7-dimethyl-8-ribityllumazine synthase [Thermotogota bacterium]
MKIYQGVYDGKDKKFAIVVSRFNSMVTEKLLKGALDCLTRHGVSEDDIEVFWVPGSLETIFVAKQLVTAGRYDGIIVLGAVIRGETFHFEVVANEVARAMAQFNVIGKVPVTFGVLTTDTVEQAVNRAGAKLGNKGFEAALVALEMANLSEQFELV